MGPRPLRIATRASALALWQAHHVAELLTRATPSADGGPAGWPGAIELVEVSTSGDRRLDVPISAIGGKGVFVKEVQAAVLDGRADIAVHSAKDMPAITPDGLTVAAVPERGDPRDVLVGLGIDDLRAGVERALSHGDASEVPTVGTGSARRRMQLADAVPGLGFGELRGNIDTRLAKQDGFSAIVMAKAALDRLGREPASVHVLPVDAMIPQVGQGTLAIECRADDADVAAALTRVEHIPSRQVFDVERAFLAALGGDCDLPAGAHATLTAEGSIELHAFLASTSEPSADAVVERFTGIAQNTVHEGPALGTLAADRLTEWVGRLRSP